MSIAQYGAGVPTHLEDQITAELKRRRSPISAREFIDIFIRIGADPHAEELTDEARAFLIDHAGLTPNDLTPDAFREAEVLATVSAARAAYAARDGALTTAEVAARLRTSTSAIRRMYAQGRLYSVGSTRQGAHLFPQWQFADTRVIPGIREVLNALPDNETPLSIAAFMTTADEVLRGMSPAEWLASGADPALVVRLADDRGWV